MMTEVAVSKEEGDWEKLEEILQQIAMWLVVAMDQRGSGKGGKEAKRPDARWGVSQFQLYSSLNSKSLLFLRLISSDKKKKEKKSIQAQKRCQSSFKILSPCFILGEPVSYSRKTFLRTGYSKVADGFNSLRFSGKKKTLSCVS